MQLNSHQEKLQNKLKSKWFFNSFLLSKLPIGWFVGLRMDETSPSKTVASVPFKWFNKNPFKSTYFAVQSMAAEFSTAVNCLLATVGHKPSVALIVVDMEAKFYKKATERVYFTCEEGAKAYEAVEECCKTGEATTASLKTVGATKNGEVISEFIVTWSFKQRKSKS